MKKHVLILLLMVCVWGCHGGALPEKKDIPSFLTPCPESPNCIFSGDLDPAHRIAPMHLAGDPLASWERFCARVARMPRTTIVQKTSTYLQVECRSMIFRFVDDLECLRDPVSGDVALRSASRVGYSDFGANRRRVETLRADLKDMNIIE